MPKHFETVDLSTAAEAQWYVKHETVQVAFAAHAGAIESREGPNRYQTGDALVTGSGGDHWSVSRARFDARYEPVPPLQSGADGAYRARALPVLALQMAEDFTVPRTRGGDWLQGHAGDWLLQYAPGDWGVVAAEKFPRVYRSCAAPS